jgi:hypothetical protein
VARRRHLSTELTGPRTTGLPWRYRRTRGADDGDAGIVPAHGGDEHGHRTTALTGVQARRHQDGCGRSCLEHLCDTDAVYPLSFPCM